MWRTIAMLVVLAALANGSGASDFYAGVGLGESMAGGQYAQPLQEFGVEASDNARKVLVGSVLSEHLAIEGSYYDFGARTCCPALADAGFETDLDGFAAALVGRLPADRFELFAKAGALFWQEKGNEITIAGPRPLSADGVDLAVGVGALWRVGGRFSLGAEWEVFEVGGDSLSGLWLTARIGF